MASKNTRLGLEINEQRIIHEQTFWVLSYALFLTFFINVMQNIKFQTDFSVFFFFDLSTPTTKTNTGVCQTWPTSVRAKCFPLTEASCIYSSAKKAGMWPRKSTGGTHLHADTEICGCWLVLVRRRCWTCWAIPWRCRTAAGWALSCWPEPPPSASPSPTPHYFFWVQK